MIHILAGDCLAEQFPQAIAGDTISCRECLIDGDLQGDSLAVFWQTRAQFIQIEYGETSYFEKVVSEIEKLTEFDVQTECCLWFEYELFCQTNFWFMLYVLKLQGFKTIYRVAPLIRPGDTPWQGFGPLDTADLEHCFAARLKMSATDLQLGADLWRAYQANDLTHLRRLSLHQSAAFPFLQEVCQAEIERKKNNRVENTLKAIMSAGVTDFPNVFAQFQEQAGVYGFGDLQLKKIYQHLLQN